MLNKSKRKIYVGTSGWMYKDWGKRFYPEDLKKDHLQYFSKFFETVEINSSFYRMPRASVFHDWHKKTPKNFIFAVKLNQFITHRKRLIIDKESSEYLKVFLDNAQQLRKKLKIILIQLPPSFKTNNDRLELFLKNYSEKIETLSYRPLSAIEFRHETWFSDQTYKLLKKYKIALVISSTPQYRRKIFTANYSYIRMHGGEKFSYHYLKKDLDNLEKEIKTFPKEVKKVFVYFNNDYSAYAIDNATYLKKKVESNEK